MKQRLVLFLTSLVMIISVQAQNGAQLQIYPTGTSVYQGSSFTIQVKMHIDSGSIDVAGAYLSFDKNKLTVIHVTDSTSVLGSKAHSLDSLSIINARGRIDYSAGTTSSFPTSDFTLLYITFTATAGGSSVTPLTFLTTDTTKSVVARHGYRIVDSLVNGSVLVCATPTATISSAASCNGADATLTLDAATGKAPYTFVIEGTTYTNVALHADFATKAFPENKIWPSNPTPANPSNNDGQSVEVGVKFRSDTAGFIKGIRFYNGSNNSGTYTGKLYNYGTSTLLGSANFSSVTTNGWQQVLFTTPIAISAHTTYIASVYSSAGNYAYTSYYFLYTGVTSGSLTALQTGVDGLNSLYRYGSGIPNNSYQAANYWVDPVFIPAVMTLHLTSITDSLGCTNSGSLQTFNATSASCARIFTNTDPGEQPKENDLSYSLFPTIPNPAGDETRIIYTIPKPGHVHLVLFDSYGRVIKVLVNEMKDAGAHTVYVNTSSFPNGIYYYSMQADVFKSSVKMVVQK